MSIAARLVGVDLARALAVFGMFAAHVGRDPSVGGAAGFVSELSHGRSSALFAVLAGFTMALITGRRTPTTGREGRRAVVKVAIRAVTLLVLGTVMTAADVPVDVILAYYGACFVMLLPVRRLGAGSLALLALGCAVIMPLVRLGLFELLPHHLSGLSGFVADLLVIGDYPALTWVTFLVAGMAVARLDLDAARVRAWLAGAGAALAVGGYGGSWVALQLLPAVRHHLGDAAQSAWWSDAAGTPSGHGPASLAVGSPFSESTFSILGNTGVALLVLTGCLTAVATLPRASALLRPLVAVGSMSLSVYVLHIMIIVMLGLDIDDAPGPPPTVLICFVLGACMFATLWSRYFPRGPLEQVMGWLTGLSRWMVP